MTVKELKEKLNNLVDVDDMEVVISASDAIVGCKRVTLFADHHTKTLDIYAIKE